MKFSYDEYFNMLFIGAICIMLFALVAIVIDIIIIIVKRSTFVKFDKKIAGYITSFILSLFLFSLGLAPFKHGMYLLNEKETDKISCSGEVHSFEKTYGLNKYTYNGENSFAYYISIDGEKYYIMHTGDIEVGDKVEFEYLPKSKIILSIYQKTN